MINATDAYREAIVGDTRRILIRSVIEILDPDIVYEGAVASSLAPWAKEYQLYDKVFETDPYYATLETSRWILDGSFSLLPDDPSQLEGDVGVVTGALSGEDGTYADDTWVELRFSSVSILQACSVFFSDADVDGVPADFSVEIRQGGTAYYAKTFTGNTAKSVYLSGFTVYDPDAIRVTVTRWSLPGRRVRIAEILPGIYERWDGNTIAEFSLKHQGDISCLSLPYGTCTLKIDNLDRRFEPRKKEGVFKSIEERQGIPISLGVRLPDGTDEYKQVGVFFQYSGGWKTGDNSMTIQWDLVDIVGLLADREFIPPEILPTTLEGWAAALVAQLGVNFVGMYTVDPDYSALTVKSRTSADVVGITCGELLRSICMATGTWPRSDSETGFLAIEPLWSQGNKITLDNLQTYPVMKANEDVAAIIFTLNDGNNTQYVVSGNTTASGETVSVSNPFISTAAQALTAARAILATYGGNKIEITGRGDMTSEIGDVDTVWLDESSATTARRIEQTLDLNGGVLQGCRSVLLQADGGFLFESREAITRSGQWSAPAGVTRIRYIIVGPGTDGESGTDGTWDAAGTTGADGAGGKVASGTIDINDGQTFDVTISDAVTGFGAYSSEDGQVFPLGYTDIASGDSFARTGVSAPLSGSGDGGRGGKGGVMGRRREVTVATESNESQTRTVIDNYPGKGSGGAKGARGCVVVYYDA